MDAEDAHGVVGGRRRLALHARPAGRGPRHRLVVAATAPEQSATAQSAPLAIRARPLPRSVSAPVVTGTAKRGRTLTAGAGTWSNDPDGFSYQWQRDGVDIPGATGGSDVLTKADVGSTSTVAVTAFNAFGSGSATAAPTGPVAAAPPVNTSVPVVTGTIQQGATVTVGGYAWDATPDTAYSLAWLRCGAGGCAPITGATGAEYMMRCTNVCVPRGAPNATTYKIAGGDLGAILRVRETASNGGGETTVWSGRYVGPVVSAQAAAAVLTSGETRLRNAKGSTLALAKLGRAAARRLQGQGHAAPLGQGQGQARRVGVPGDDQRGRHAAAVQRQGHVA